jgi:hypothetical protein
LFLSFTSEIPRSFRRVGPGIDRITPPYRPLPAGRNPFEGFHTKRVYSPLAKARALDDLVLSPWIAELADGLIGPHTLSSVIAIQIGPGEIARPVHYDAAAYPLPRTFREVVFNMMWAALEDFTVEDGATVLYPGSNHWAEVPDLADVTSIQAEMPVGSALIWPGPHTPWRRGKSREPVSSRSGHRVRRRLATTSREHPGLDPR